MNGLLQTLGLLGISGGAVFAGANAQPSDDGRGKLPAQALPLSSVLREVEKQGFTPVCEVDFDDGLWEIEAFSQGEAVEINVDPATGKVVHQQADEPKPAPASPQPSLSQLAMELEKQGFSPIVEISREAKGCEVEAYRDGVRRELLVDPASGKVISDRVDR